MTQVEERKSRELKSGMKLRKIWKVKSIEGNMDKLVFDLPFMLNFLDFNRWHLDSF